MDRNKTHHREIVCSMISMAVYSQSSVILHLKCIFFCKLNIPSLQQTNTFQCILVTDNVQSFAIFLYADGLMQWTTADSAQGSGGVGGIPAQVGFDAGDGLNYANLPGSRTPDILNLAITTNSRANGQWIFLINSVQIPGKHTLAL